MSTARERQRNNVLTGIFVLVAILLMVSIVVVLSGVWGDLTRSTRTYTAIFRVTDGVENLRTGAAVRVGGIEMGRVSSVRPRYRQDMPLDEIEVAFRVDQRVTLFSDASIGVRTPLLGTEPWVEIHDVGGREGSTAAPDVIVAMGRAAMIDTMLGPATAAGVRDVVAKIQDHMNEGDTLLAAVIGADAMLRLSSLLDESGEVMVNVRELSEWMAMLPEEYQLRVVPILDDTGASVASIRLVTGDLAEEQWPAWTERIELLLSDLNRGIDEGAMLVEDARSMIADVRPNVLSAAQGADTAVQRINDETIDRLNGALEQLGGAVTSIETVVARIGTDYPQWSAYVDETLSRLALTAQQAQLAAIEVRRSPWKVLYRPGPKELEHELLYEAARSFALAAGDLRAAGGAVDRLMDMHGETLASDPALLQRLTTYLGGPLDRYEQAQRALFDLLLEQKP